VVNYEHILMNTHKYFFHIELIDQLFYYFRDLEEAFKDNSWEFWHLLIVTRLPHQVYKHTEDVSVIASFQNS
jgi:hypothetical protein